MPRYGRGDAIQLQRLGPVKPPRPDWLLGVSAPDTRDNKQLPVSPGDPRANSDSPAFTKGGTVVYTAGCP